MPYNCIHLLSSSSWHSFGIKRTDDRVVGSNGGKQLGRNLPSFPLNQNIPLGSLVNRMIGLEWAFVSNNVLELPDCRFLVILKLGDVVQHLVVGQDLLVPIVIDSYTKLESFQLWSKVIILIFDGLDNLSMETLTILLNIRRV